MIPWTPIAVINWQKYVLILGTIVLLFATGYLKGCTDEREKSVAFKAKIEAQAEAQEKRVKEIEAQDRKRKELADAENKRNRDHIATLARQLRDARSSRGYLPPATPSSPSPDRATLDRAELERALRQLDEDVSGLLTEGDQGVAELNVARRWWQEQTRIR